MANFYIGEIRVFGFSFAALDWAFCNGALQSISQNTTLYTLIGTTYGGDGVNTFALPNLQDRIGVGMGQGPGLTNRDIGAVFGESSHTLAASEVPAHTHTLIAGDNVSFPTEGRAPTASSYYGRERGGAYSATANTTLHPSAIGLAGGSQPHSNVQPILTMNHCIALFGIFPSQN
jgi:microcystin-dependent protein